MALTIVFVSLLILINTDTFQNYLTQKVANWLSREIDYPITIGKVGIDWFDELRVEDIQINDTTDSTMIRVRNIVLNYQVTDVLFNKTPALEAASIVEPYVILTRHAGAEQLNITEFIWALNERFRKKKTKKKVTLFQLEYATIQNGIFGYYDQTKPAIEGKLDYNHLRLEYINARVSNFSTNGRDFDFDVNHLSAYEGTQDKKIERIKGHYSYTNRKMYLSELEAVIGESYISNYIAFEYDTIKDFSDFNSRIRIITDLDSTVITSKDLEMFAPSLKSLKDTWVISGKSHGTVNSLSTDSISLSFGKSSIVKGKFNFDGLPVFYETFLDLNVVSGSINTSDLAQYFPKSAKHSIQKFGQTVLNGSFTGFPLDFVAYGSFNTDIGYFRSDINLKLSEKTPRFEGNLVTKNFNLGVLIDQSDVVGNISMVGNIEGTGLDIDKLEMDLDASISKFKILGYNYRNITTVAHISKEVFEGEIMVKDENITLDAAGIASFKNDQPIFNIHTYIPHANLQKLFGLELESQFSARATLNFQGIEIDNINGSSVFKNLFVSYGEKQLNVDSIFMISTIDSNHRFFELKSSIANVMLNGDFNFTSMVQEMGSTISEYRMYFENKTDTIADYYKNKPHRVQHNKSFFKIDFVNIDSLVMLYTQNDFHIEPHSYISGNLSISDTLFSLEMESELNDVLFNNTHTEKLYLYTKTDKDPFSNNIASTIQVKSNEQELLKDYKTEDFYCNVDWNNEQILFSSGIRQKDNPDNNIVTSGEIVFLRNYVEISLDSLELNIQKQQWLIDTQNTVQIRTKQIDFEHFKIISGVQTISVAGRVSDRANDTLSVGFSGIGLEILDPFLPRSLGGVMNGKVNISRIFTNLVAAGDLEVENFIFSESHFGNLKGMVRWIDKDKSIYSDINFIKDEKKILNFKGRIMPFEKEDNLNLLAKIYPTQLKTIEPIFKEYASKFKGEATGKVWIKGPFRKPLFNGHIFCQQAGLRVNYLKTDYTFNDFIYLEDDMFSLKDLTLKDEFQHTAKIFGNIIHENFSKYHFDLFGSFTNFQLLNTSIEDNELYYGTAYATGTFGIQGPMNDISIWTEARSDRETHLHIPLASYEDIEQSDYIFFKKPKEEQGEKTDTLEKSGIKLDFNLDITPEAYFEIIFDLKAGDIIRGRGNGNLRLGIDTRGDFSLFGKYELEQGGYNFTIMNLVNKEFAIEKGSTINWDGNPYEGALDIKARYEQNASLKPIIDTSFNPQIFNQYPALMTKKFPVDVLLDLSGELMHPHIDLDIDIKKGYPMVLNPSVNQFNSIIKNNEQELNRQVFSLMILKQLSTINSMENFDLGNTANNSISELLSNQLSYWMSQVDENLEVEIDLNSLDQDALNTFQLRLSYTFLDGKLRVTRDGNFTNYNNQASASSIAGEWTIEYLLREDGKLRVKMYNKNNQNSLFSGLQNTSNNSAGVSLLFTESFNKLADLWRKKSRKKTKTKKK